MKQMIEDVLVINTYAGSLLIAATKIGLPIRGSYEDAGFGSKIQTLNFPDVPRLTKRSEWPKQDLSNTMVVAHPPCSGFSTLSLSLTADKRRNKMGVDSDAFGCTVNVLDYAMQNRAAVICLESVVPAMEGGREIHDGLANDFDYSVYRVLQNAKDMGVAQDRKRFWAVFVRRDLDNGMNFNLHKIKTTVGHVLNREPFDEPLTTENNRMQRMRELFRLAGVSNVKMTTILRGDHGHGRSHKVVKKALKLEDENVDVAERYIGRRYENSCPVLLDPDGQAPTLLSASVWMYRGKMLTPSQYKLLMGFPARYKIPGGSTNIKMFLSKGVCPPVAEWVMKTALCDLADQNPKRFKSGDVVDLR